MEFPAKTPIELADDLSRCEKVTLKFDNENHTLTPREVGWLVASLMSQNAASFDAPDILESPDEGLIHGIYPHPVEHYERVARNLANVWTNGNRAAEICILSELLKAARGLSGAVGTPPR